MQMHLLELWDKFAPALAQSLEVRMRDRTNGLQKKLAERAEKESQDIQSILLELKKAIDAELNTTEMQQGFLLEWSRWKRSNSNETKTFCLSDQNQSLLKLNGKWQR